MDYLLPYKPAADILCGMQHVDPDERVTLPHPLIANATITRPAWELRAEALIDLSQMLLSLRLGAPGPTLPTH